MKNLEVSPTHSIPAFAVGCFAWSIASFLLATIDRSVLVLPGWGPIYTAAIFFFPVFFILRKIKFLNVYSLVGSIVFVTIALTIWLYPGPTTTILLQGLLAVIASCAAFLVLRGGAAHDARSKA